MDKMSYSHFVLALVLVVTLAVVVSCGGRESAPTLLPQSEATKAEPMGQPTAPYKTPLPTPTPRLRPTPTGEGNAEGTTTVTITGTVQDVMRSAQIIMFREPVKGFLYVALTQDTRLISREGRNITLQKIEAGMRIQVTGRPGNQGTLLAEEVRILP